MAKSTLSGLSSAVTLAVVLSLLACSEKQPSATESAPSAAAPLNVNAAPVQETEVTVEVEKVEVAEVAEVARPVYSPESLETLLAPVALYPDLVLAQVLASSTNPQEVLDAGNWLVANPKLKGKELEAAGTAVGFTPPTMALMHFPTVIDMMCMKMDWTTELGTAFQANEPGVLEAVQRLRKQAADMGNLKSSEQMKVTTEEQNDQQVIVVQPADPQVIYVPQYNPATVYTTPAPATTTSTTAVATTSTGYSGGEMVATGLLAFGAGILVSEVFDDDDDDDYYSPHWGYGGSPYYPPPYQPRYGNGFRPANGYNRPPNYQHGFNNNMYVNTDGKDYFNRFERGKNNYRKQARSPISETRPNRPELGELNQRAQTAQRPAATSKLPKGTYAGATNAAARQKLNPLAAGARDRGHAAGTAAPPAVRQQHTAETGSRPAARPNVAKPAARKAPGSRSSAFQGSRNQGNAERAASNRGRASMPKGGRSSSQGNFGQSRGNRR